MARKAVRFPKSITIHSEIWMMTAIEKAAIQNDRDPEQEIRGCLREVFEESNEAKTLPSLNDRSY
jgi:hypothetical protein